MANKNYTIYKHTTPDGKVYIGITCNKLNRRWQNGLDYKNNRDFTNAISFYGWENITHDVLAKELPASLAEKLEDFYIEKYNSRNPEFGYNRHAGGKLNNEDQNKKSRGVPRPPIAVRCVETGKEYPAMQVAARELNTTQTNITQSLRKGYRAGGFHWELAKL